MQVIDDLRPGGPRGCIEAPPPRYYADDPTRPRLKLSADRIDTFVATPMIREGAADPEAQSMHTPGFAEPATVHPVRFDDRLPSGPREVCAYRSGAIVLDDQGFGRAVFGNRPGYEREGTVMGAPVISDGQNVPGVEPGFGCFVGGYQTPEVYEAHYYSTRPACGDALE